jgi:hypothetical protein
VTLGHLQLALEASSFWVCNACGIAATPFKWFVSSGPWMTAALREVLPSPLLPLVFPQVEPVVPVATVRGMPVPHTVVHPYMPASPQPVVAEVEHVEETLDPSDPSSGPTADPPLEAVEQPLELVGQVVQGCYHWHPSHSVSQLSVLLPHTVVLPSVAAWTGKLRRPLTAEWLLTASQRPCQGIFQMDMRTGDLLVFQSHVNTLGELHRQLTVVDLGQVHAPEVIRRQQPVPLQQLVLTEVSSWTLHTYTVTMGGLQMLAETPAEPPRDGNMVVGVPVTLEVPEAERREVVAGQIEAVGGPLKYRVLVGRAVEGQEGLGGGSLSPYTFTQRLLQREALPHQEHQLLRSALHLRRTREGGLEVDPLSWALGGGVLRDMALVMGRAEWDGAGFRNLALYHIPRPLQHRWREVLSEESPKRMRADGSGARHPALRFYREDEAWFQELQAMVERIMGPAREVQVVYQAARALAGGLHRHPHPGTDTPA